MEAHGFRPAVALTPAWEVSGKGRGKLQATPHLANKKPPQSKRGEGVSHAAVVPGRGEGASHSVKAKSKGKNKPKGKKSSKGGKGASHP